MLPKRMRLELSINDFFPKWRVDVRMTCCVRKFVQNYDGCSWNTGTRRWFQMGRGSWWALDGAAERRRNETDNKKVTVRRLHLYMNEMNLYVPQQFFCTDSGEAEDEKAAVYGSIVGLALLDAWIGTFATCMTNKERRRCHQQNLYAKHYWMMPRLHWRTILVGQSAKWEAGKTGEISIDREC